MSKTILTNYKPRPIQQFLHDNCTRFTVAIAHRRFGKSMWALNHILRKAFQNKLQNPQYMFIAPQKAQAKDVAWEALKRYLKGIPGVEFRIAELKVVIPFGTDNSITIFVRGGEEAEYLRGLYLDGVIIDEVSDMPRYAWEGVLRPALSDRRGWAVFIGTPKGKNYLKELYERGRSGLKGWSSYLFRASDTGVIDEEEIEMLRAEMPEELFKQEYECSFEAAVPGSYYGKQLADLRARNSIREFEIDMSKHVITAWDIGINDKTTIWFAQNLEDGLKIIDYYECSGEALTHYVNLIKSKPYTYDYHILPHDVHQRNWSTGFTRLQELEKSGLKCRVAPRLPVADGINAVKSILPICTFNEKMCEKGIDALSYYHSVYDSKRDVQVLTPEHDWSSHAADAFRYLALTIKPLRKEDTHRVFKNGMFVTEKLKAVYTSDYDFSL